MLKMFKADDNEIFRKELLKEEINTDKIQKLIDKGIDINKQDDKGRSIIFTLVARKKIESIRLLLNNNVNIYLEDNYGKTVLNDAITKSDGMMIRFLLDNTNFINHKNSVNRTVIQDISLEGNFRIFQILMNYKPDLNLKDDYGKTVLFDAVNGGNVNIIREIANNIDDINIVDENGQTVLFEAVLKDDFEITEALILNGIDVDLRDNKGQNVLFNTVLLGLKGIKTLELLIEKDINLDQKDNNNRTILDEIIYLLDTQKTSMRELEGNYTLLKEDTHFTEITLLLVESGLDINRLDDNGLTALYKEIERKNYENIEFLIDCGSDINFKDNEGRNLFHHEVLKGSANYAMISYLVNNGIDIDNRDNYEKSIFDYLCEIIMVQKGLKEDCSLENFEIDEDEKYDVLFKRLLLFRPKLTKTTADGRNILFEAILYNNFEFLTLLFNYGMDPNIIDNNGNSLLSVLVDDGLKIKNPKLKDLFLERLVFLLKFRVNVDIQDKDGKTVFHKAVIANNLAVVEKLLTKKADLNLKDNQGRTALQHTQWNGNYKIARWLIAAGANINEPDNAGFTLLNYAAIFGHINLVIALLVSGVLMYNKNQKSKKVALFFKSKEKNLDKLLNNNISDEKMRRALIEVAENTKKEINEVLQG
ncbi:ankyrin repeat domain-containing protein [Poseidonibacter sp.]|uniref:ankyrin repeat domain-containing protein n=1 Tax=Poseidonibacter sp. TaxID=2321188 RepID=UPI003C734138